MVARRYVNRLTSFLDGFRQFPMRGNLHPEIRSGLLIIGFERRVSVAFIVDETEVLVLRLLYGGRSIEPDELE
ncbi:MAG: type II toxin-antitoxin system RelE/ParE family toxin [Mesorhizobium sp.]|nr:type II toxin-antitoxin system RelE/ParE family toxin [Mesorhizobium sp.]